MERRLFYILGMVGLVLAGVLFVVRIRKEPLPSGIHALLKMKADDPANTRLAHATDECIDAWQDLRLQRDRAELTAIIVLTLFSVATLVIARRLPQPAGRSTMARAEDPHTPASA